jgi:hypothetical protein
VEMERASLFFFFSVEMDEAERMPPC